MPKFIQLPELWTPCTECLKVCADIKEVQLTIACKIGSEITRLEKIKERADIEEVELKVACQIR